MAELHATDYLVLNSDARSLGLPDSHVQMIITSVPYWGLRAYIDDEQEIGREGSLQDWVDNLVACAREWRRILRDDGTLWINCGDTYAGGMRGANSDGSWSCGAKQRANPGSFGQVRAPDVPPGMKPKDLIGMPWILAFALRADGWYLRSAICWSKSIDWSDAERDAQRRILDEAQAVRNVLRSSLWGLPNEIDASLRRIESAVGRIAMTGSVMPESVSDRPSTAYEMLFLFSKSPSYYYDQDAIRLPQSSHTHARLQGATPKDQAPSLGSVRANRSFHAATGGRDVPGGRNARNVWRVPNEGAPPGGYRLSDGSVVHHFASFPRALPHRAILAGTSAGGACATCGAPFRRVTVPTPEYAECLGDWADYEQDAAEGRGHSVNTGIRPVKRSQGCTHGLLTLAWYPTCRCHGEPLPLDVPCPACRGTGRERIYPPSGLQNGSPHRTHRGTVGMSGGRYQTLAAEGGDGKVESGAPCPHCLCPTCRGTGRQRTTAPRVSAHFSPEDRRDSATRGVTANVGENSMTDAGECPTCHGAGALGRVVSETWDARVLASWPRRPCIVLDPMAGTGQTGMAARDAGRSAILNDLNPQYCALMQARLAAWPEDCPGAKAAPVDSEDQT